MDEQFFFANPILPVKSVDDTLNFYKTQLGFTVAIAWNDPAYGVVRRGNAVIEFGEHRKEYAGTGICIIGVENADVIYQEWKSRNIEFVGDFADRDYGNKDFRIRDNNGNMLIIGHALTNKCALLRKGNVADRFLWSDE